MIQDNVDIFKSGEKIKRIKNINKRKLPKGIEHLMWGHAFIFMKFN